MYSNEFKEELDDFWTDLTHRFGSYHNWTLVYDGVQLQIHMSDGSTIAMIFYEKKERKDCEIDIYVRTGFFAPDDYASTQPCLAEIASRNSRIDGVHSNRGAIANLIEYAISLSSKLPLQLVKEVYDSLAAEFSFVKIRSDDILTDPVKYLGMPDDDYIYLGLSDTAKELARLAIEEAQ